jgi:hypothetical protein
VDGRVIGAKQSFVASPGHDGCGLFVRSILKQDTRSHSRGPSRPSFCKIIRPSNKEGAGNAGCPMHPQPRVRNKKAHELVTTGSPQQSGIPCAMVLTVSFVLFPVTGLFCHRGLRDRARRLGISVGMPEPHDFAVRKKCRSSGDTPASIASRFTFRDDCAYAPLTRGGMARIIRLICVSEKAKYF